MQTEIEDAMKALLEKAKNAKGSDEALRFSQSVLNLAHAQNVIKTTASQVK